jgi:peptidyl-prolyl cis-trans isomerase B (cyclophilin B)
LIAHSLGPGFEKGEFMNDVEKGKALGATIQVSVKGESWGNIQIKLLPEVAPNHVKNLVKLAQEKFYDGTTFHRVIPGFMIQGGDPNTKHPDRSTHGLGGPEQRLAAEFNNTPHKRGVVSMARSSDPNSAGSQFFICVADVPHLDGQYTAFGEVVSGMETVDRIVSVKRDDRDNPLDRVEVKIEATEG